MNLTAHFLVALVYMGAFLLRIRSEKKAAWVFVIAASLLLVLTGLCLSNDLYLICIVWACIDIFLMGYMLFSKNTMKLLSLIIIQVIFVILWGYMTLRS